MASKVLQIVHITERILEMLFLEVVTNVWTAF